MLYPARDRINIGMKSDKIRYAEILGKADSVVYSQEKYTYDCMMKRNMYMIDKSLYVFALWDRQSGGTANTIKYALEKERRIIIINPVTMKISTNRKDTLG